MNVLFVCSRNRWRSLTAETIFKNTPGWEVRSGGTSWLARIRVNEKMLIWADIIFVMENKHDQILRQKFSNLLTQKSVINLGISDEYHYMDPELIELLKAGVEAHL